jgi:hypothetical protein
MVKKSLILASSLVASTIFLSASILPVAYAQTPRLGSFRDTETLTVERDSVPEMREEVRQELSDLRLPIQQQLALENQIMIEIQKEISVDDDIIEVAITIIIDCTFFPRCVVIVDGVPILRT